ncbi:MAG: PQQ-dependent sugar dehydrogenase, partial [Microvirga sp.]
KRDILLGKLLRLDVDHGEPYAIPPDNPWPSGGDVRGEIWAYGLRNPWRFSFDRATGDLYIGDVGQGQYEEIDFQPAGEPGGRNYGWNMREGLHCYQAQDCDTKGLVDPIAEYSHQFGCSVTGGYVYRGSHAPWAGKYIFGDWSKGFDAMDGQIFIATKGVDGKWTHEKATVPGMTTMPYMLAFAQDDKGDVFALTSISTGPVGGHDKIYRIVPAD